MKMISRRQVALGLGATALALSGSLVRAQGQGPVKIGVLTIDSGPFATHSGLIEDAARTAIDILNADSPATGPKFEMVLQRHSGTPASAMQAAARLVQSGASFITGQTPSNHSLALAPKLAEMNALLIDVYSQSDDLMTKACQPNYFRVTTPDSVITNLLREYIKTSGIKTWNLISADYAGGRTFSTKFTEVVQSLGGTVQQSLFAPMGTSDFGGYISQLSKPSEGLMVTLFMSDGTSFAKQQKQFGLFEKYKTVTSNGFATPFQLDAMGDSVQGVFNALQYHYTMPGERNAAYVKAFEARLKRKPIYTDSDIMVALEMLKAAMVKAKSTDPQAVRKTLAGLKAPTIYGELEMREADHHLVRQHGMAEVVKGADGKMTYSLKYIKTGKDIYPAPSAECKI